MEELRFLTHHSPRLNVNKAYICGPQLSDDSLSVETVTADRTSSISQLLGASAVRLKACYNPGLHAYIRLS